MVTEVKKFGSTCKLSEGFLKKALRCGVLASAKEIVGNREWSKLAEATDAKRGARGKRLVGIEKARTEQCKK